jgi:cytochrome b subunit of formate dehydrogenase
MFVSDNLFRKTSWRAFLLVMMVAALFLGLGRASRGDELTPAQLQNPRCLSCHGQANIATLPATQRQTMIAGEVPDKNGGPRPGLSIDPVTMGSSVHAGIPCVSCHPVAQDLPHKSPMATATCVPCHQQQQDEYSGSVHGKAIAGGSKEAARCPDCHGAHDIISHQNPQSRTYRLNLPFTCAKCHSNSKMTAQEHVRQPQAAEQYIDSMHGRALLVSGLIVAPTCNDCHGVHAILPASDPRSSVNKKNVPDTCGKCHIGVEQIYGKSIHGRLLAKGDDRGPVCVTCHTPHNITKPGEAVFKAQSDERCGQCHSDRLKHYRETFHGKAMALGRTGVAACYDCHGHHDIVPVSDPKSRLAGANKIETCRKCHANAPPAFASYIAHADHGDRLHYPVLYWVFICMTCIVLGTFAFFGVHSAFWFVRSFVLYVRNPKAFREAKVKAAKDDEEYVRFGPFERFLHFLVITSFLTLVATGMPLKFYETKWAHAIISWMGGLEVAAGLHRIGAVITFLYFSLHLASVAKAGFKRRQEFRDPKTGRLSLRRVIALAMGPDMPLPNLTDAKDWWAHQKWFLGRGPQPQFDRWTYWEKFDYMAVFWGVAIIGATGLIMWFPTIFTRFLPGWMINVALIVHSDEALLAAGFIFTFHFFNVHFRLEKFPMDPVIFSGRMSKTEMIHERKRWYDRLLASKQLEKMRVKDDWAQWKRVMHPVGFLAFGIGVALLVLIFIAMSARLLGLGQ